MSCQQAEQVAGQKGASGGSERALGIAPPADRSQVFTTRDAASSSIADGREHPLVNPGADVESSPAPGYLSSQETHRLRDVVLGLVALAAAIAWAGMTIADQVYGWQR